MFIPFGDDVERTKIPKGVISLIIINVLVAAYEFRLAQDYGTHPEYFDDFLMTFGLVPKDVPTGSMTGLFTYMFLHGGLMHLFGNMLVLWREKPAQIVPSTQPTTRPAAKRLTKRELVDKPRRRALR